MEPALSNMPVYFTIHAGRKRYGLYIGDNSQIKNHYIISLRFDNAMANI
jgi:hypothetical protein